jgi:diguanylate cyclase (GGDEF)-like protein
VTDVAAALRTLLAGVGTVSDLPAGVWLWREGEPGDGVVLVREGLLQVVHEGAGGERVVLRELEAGAVLGEISCLDGEPRSASVRASTASRVSRVSAAEFRQLLHHNPVVLEALLLQQVRIVRSLTSQVTKTHRRAITDALTHLYNMGFFVERLGMELVRAYETQDPLSVVMLDVDHFKHYNDTNGHQDGNAVLVQLADILRAAGRRGEVIARYGGEEFVTLLYGAGRDEARRFAETVRRAVEAATFPGGERQPLGRVTISGGVASFPEDAKGQDDLIEAADQCLYRAKQAGRNRIVGPG